MAQNVIINGVTYQNVPEVDIPKSGGGSAKFYDTSGADFAAADFGAGRAFTAAAGAFLGVAAFAISIASWSEVPFAGACAAA